MTETKSITQYLIIIPLTILLLVGGMGFQSTWVPWIGALLSSLFLIISYLRNDKIILPRGSVAYLVFIIIFGISLLWSKDAVLSFNYFLLFLSGGLFWVFFYNYRNKDFGLTPDYLIVLLGLTFGVIYLLNYLTGMEKVNSYSLIFYSTGTLDHHHIGDFWAAVIGLLVYRFYKKKYNPIFLFPLILSGIFFLVVSQSRSAYIALISGLLYFFFANKKLEHFKKYIYILIFIALSLFVLSSINKGLISHRLFYISGILGVLEHPFGVGVGNFGYVLNENLALKNLFGFSAVADNLPLDILVGLGVFSLPFFYWVFIVLRDFWQKRGGGSMGYQIIFVILTVNFMFNHIYFIPTVLWIWFVSLGLSESVKNQSLVK